MPYIAHRAFLITTKDRTERIFREFPRMAKLDKLVLDSEKPDYKALRDALLRTLSGEIAIVFPFPLWPYYEPAVISKQITFALASPSRVLVSVYPRPDRVIRISKEPLVLGDLLISPSSLWRIVDKRI